MIEDNIVIVIDLGNYKKSHSEKVPFRAKVINKSENEIWVKSLVTCKEYELYRYQILECFDEYQLSKIINLNNEF